MRQGPADSRLLARYGLCDRALAGWTVVWTAAVLVAFGIASAIIPNPVFGRGLPPGPGAVGVWLASAPLMGFVMATYFSQPSGFPVPVGRATASGRDGTTLGTLGGFAAFLAIGCPTCNKIALLLLGAGGAASVFGPIQPAIGAVSLVLLGLTAVWRLRLRARGNSCEIPARETS